MVRGSQLPSPPSDRRTATAAGFSQTSLPPSPDSPSSNLHYLDVYDCSTNRVNLGLVVR